MIIRHPYLADWENFFALACTENWRVPRIERQLFMGPWSQYAHVLDDKGFRGLVTAVAYEKSAWIGNLIVPRDQRGKGYGSHLFRSVLSDIVAQGTRSVWLTASDQGRCIYEREGFVAVDRIERWILPPQQGAFDRSEILAHDSCESLLCMDSRVWGESRLPLLSKLCEEGEIFSVGNSIALLQKDPDRQIIGPWYSHNAGDRPHADLLQALIASSCPSVEVVIDCLSSSPIPPLCDAAGFTGNGQTALMVYGDIKAVNLRSVMSLASLGSIG